MGVSISHPDVDFETTSASQARVRSTITTAEPDEKVSFAFTIGRGDLLMRVGTTAGAQDIVADLRCSHGFHIVSFTPGVSTYYLEFGLPAIGKAGLRDFERVAAGRFEIDTPWVESELDLVRLQQSLNVVYAAVSTKRPRVIERRGDTSWSIRDYDYTDGPFNPLNGSTYTLTPSALTGEVTITANTALFTSLDVGMLLKLTHTGQYETASATAVDTTTDAIRVSGLDTSRRFTYAVTGSFTATVVLERSVGNELSYETVQTFTGAASGTYDDELDNQIIYYRLRVSAYTSGTVGLELRHSQGVTDGVARIFSVDADNQVTADVLSPFSKTSATTLWYMGAWAARFGWPAAVGMQDGRLALGRGDNYWLSAADDFESQLVGANDADAISRTLTGKMNSIAWLKGAKNLLAGTTGAEHIITAGEYSEILTPSTAFSRPVSSRGSAQAEACMIDTAVAFISRSRKRIYLAVPADGDGYQLIDLTRLHPDIGGASGFKEIAFQTEPHPRLWCVRNDGAIAVLLLVPEEEIVAWTRYTSTGATFESVAVIPAGVADDGVYFVTHRPDVSATDRYIEKLAPESFTDLEDAWRLQCAVEYSGAATTALTGLDHLEGEEVYVWGNGRQSGPYTVSSGAITCDYEVTYAVIGLLYEGKYKGPRITWGASAGTAVMQEKLIKILGLMLYRTPGGMIRIGQSFDADKMTGLEDRQTGLTYDSALQEWTEDKRLNVDGFSDPDARLHISMPGAGPATVLGLIPWTEASDR
ncbi:MAG: hypothetical protein GOVbin52_42 [Prokaryotic dsDNA virus sp.]|nr:MAG: hypothetical protein GOVbin52_42 [Prokaryotic dsDNA virus sp.]|tara:strand:+ start:18765 stop:21041 length:2277 start_codon:yes stop_codon:yes gene_type:complete